MFFFNKQKRTALTIKDHVIRYVQADGPKLDKIKQMGEIYFPKQIVQNGKIINEQAFMTILREGVSRRKITGQSTLFHVPNASSLMRTEVIPAQLQEKEEIIEYLQLNLGKTIHLPFGDPVFDIGSIREKSQDQKQITLVASPKAVVDQYQHVLTACKLKPIVADLAPLSVYRYFNALEPIVGIEHLLIVANDINALNMTIFHEHEPLFTRNVQIGLDQDRWSPLDGELLWEGDEDELEHDITERITELERVLNFYRFSLNKGEQGITKVLLLGDHPKIELIAKRISENFGLESEWNEQAKVPLKYIETVGLSIK